MDEELELEFEELLDELFELEFDELFEELLELEFDATRVRSAFSRMGFVVTSSPSRGTGAAWAAPTRAAAASVVMVTVFFMDLVS